MARESKFEWSPPPKDIRFAWRTAGILLVKVAVLYLQWTGASRAAGASQISSEYFVRHFTTADGLPDNRVYALDTGPDGYLWIGSQAGIASFDGVRFRKWDSANLAELTDAQIRSISVSPGGEVWACSRREVILFSSGSVKRFRPDLFDMPAFAIRRIMADDEGAWLGSDYGLFRAGRNGSVRKYSMEEGLPHRAIASLHADRHGTVWAGTVAGLARFLEDEDRFATDPGSHAFLGRSVQAVHMDPAGRSWIIAAPTGPGAEARQISQHHRGIWTDLDASNVVNGGRTHGAFLKQDRLGRVWAPAGPGALYRLEKGEIRLIRLPEPFQNDFPLCFAEDREGNLWVGMENEGLIQLRLKAATILEKELQAPLLKAEAILETTDGVLWIGGSDGLCRIEGDVPAQIVAPDRMRVQHIRALIQDRDGRILAGAREGLYRVEEGVLRKAFDFNLRETPKVRALIQAEDGAIWAGTIRGVYRFFNGEARVWTAPELAERQVRALAQDGQGRIWASVLGEGINIYHDGVWTLLSEEDGLASNYVWDFYLDEDGYMWIATRLGLTMWDGAKLRTLKSELNHQIDQIVSDDSGGLWFASPRGVCRMDRTALVRHFLEEAPLGTVWYYGQEEGMPSLSFAGEWSQGGGLRLGEGSLLFAGDKGVVRIHPKTKADLTAPPVPVIEQISANQRVLYRNAPFVDKPNVDAALFATLDEVLRFAPGAAQVIEIDFSSPAFAAPNQTKFLYRLLGMSERWRSLGVMRHVTFANLAPGEYAFELMAENKYGVTSAKPAGFPFVVEPFFTETAAFYAAIGAALALGIAGAHLWRLRKVARIRELEAQVQLASQRESFARAMHDELGAEVSSIVRLATPMPGLSASEAAQRLSRVGVIARELSHSVRDSIWAATPEHDNLEETLSKIRDYAARFLSDAGIQRSIIIPEDPPARRIPGEFRKGVFLIIKEALHNAVKHGDATEVSLTISVAQNLTIELSDNGVGFDSTDASPASKGRGLKDMRMRAAGLGGSFQIVSVPREGTRITVTVPLE